MTSVATPAHDHGRHRGFAVWAVLLTMGCMLAMLGATNARAATNYASGGEFGNGAFVGPTKVAVDDATGNVLVVDSGNNQIQVYGPGGSSSSQLATFGSSDLLSPYGIAIDQSSHAVYVTDTGHNSIVRYTTDGLPVPTYTLDITYSGPPAAGSPQVGSLPSAIAVDQTNGDLLVADTGQLRVSRYTSSGSLVDSFTGADTAAGAFKNPLDVAVGPTGDLYVVDLDGTVDPSFSTIQGTSRVEHFDAGGASLGRLDADALKLARSVTVDLGTENVIVAVQEEFPSAATLRPYHDGLSLGVIPYPAGTAMSAAVGLAADAGGSGRLYALTSTVFGVPGLGVSSIQVFDPVPLPDLVVDAPSTVGQTTAHISGTVDPLGAPNTKYQFELNDGQSWTPVGSEVQIAVADAVDHDLVDLVPNSTYTVRLRGTNDNGTIYTPGRSFTTLTSAPDVETEAATDRTATGATLRGFVTPYGLQTTYHFEWGPTTGYGSRVPANGDRAAGDGYSPHHVQYALSGLQPAQTYHYRLVARSSAGQTAGPDRTFVTATGADPVRTYEMVSPVDKGGANVHTNYTVRSSLDGDRVAYFTTTPIPGLAQAAPGFSRYLAARGAGGWLTVAVDPPQLRDDLSLNTANTLGISEDGKKAVVVSLAKLTPGAVEGASNTYLKDLETGAYAHIATAPGTEFNRKQRFGFLANELIGGSPDYSHVVITGDEWALLPGAPTHAVYEFSNGKLRLVSRAQDGTPFSHSASANSEGHDIHPVSDDGRRIILGGSASDPVYVRIDGATTVTVSASQRTADPPGTVRPATFWSASSDGRFIFIVAADLTDDSPPGEASLYRYDVDARELTFLTRLGVNSRFYQASRDATAVYFASPQVLAPGANLTGNNLYVWRAGETRLVAALDNSLDQSIGNWRASPSGRYFAFRAYSQLTAYDNSSTACTDVPNGDPPGARACAEIYRYDANTGDLTCPSCRRDGGHPTGNARMAVKSGEQDTGGPYWPRSVFDDGRVFFDTPDPIGSADTNSKRDVYVSDGDDVQLISSGHGGTTGLGDVSPDGRDVFFTTRDQLVSQDNDTLTDLYVARIGGGIASPSGDPTCAGEDCRGATPGPRAPDQPASQRVAGADHPPAAPGKAKVAITSATFTGTVLKLTVNVSGAGRVRASGAKIVAATRTTSKSGRYALQARMTKKQRALRRAGRKVRAAITVSFTPVYGQRASTHITRTAAR